MYPHPRTALQLAKAQMTDQLKTELALKPVKRPKYGNRKTILDGHSFDSAREAREYLYLKAREKAGEISRLELHPVYKFIVEGVNIGRFTPDFQYYDNKTKKFHVIDVKSPATASETAFRIRKKLLWALYGIELEVVT
jgi:hypothetical protein